MTDSLLISGLPLSLFDFEAGPITCPACGATAGLTGAADSEDDTDRPAVVRCLCQHTWIEERVPQVALSTYVRATLTHHPRMAQLLRDLAAEEQLRRNALDQADEHGHREALAVLLAFHDAVVADDVPNVPVLRHLVTPESWPSWDFDDLRPMLAPLELQPSVDAPGGGAVGVLYGVLQDLRGADPVALAAGTATVPGLIVTLQMRQAGRWQVHHVGDYVRPEDLPAL